MIKVIISHDIDHISATEHLFKDLYIPKALLRNTIELCYKTISIKEYFSRYIEYLSNKIQYIDEQITYDQSKGIEPIFFIGLDNALNLSYSQKTAAYWASHIIKRGGSVGLHGIAYDDFNLMQKEKNDFNSLIGNKGEMGIRMHYLRKSDKTLSFLSQLSYKYDSTDFAEKNPYQVNGIWEFPVQIMDVYEIYDKSFQRKKSKKIISSTKEKIDRIVDKGLLNYLNIISHDRYFSKNYSAYYEWYQFVVEYIYDLKIPFTTFEKEIKILNRINEQ